MQNFKRSHVEETVSYELTSDDGFHNGFELPCDAEGNVLPDLNEAAQKNLAYCLAHPEKFARHNKVVPFVHRVRIPASGTCRCGQEVELSNQYYGSCQCPNCGQWYSMSGNELLPPDRWGWDGTPW